MERILVTGASGFVGRRLLQRLSANGAAVTVAIRSSSSHPAPVEGVCPSIVGSIGPSTDWRNALADCDCVIHLAAQVPGRNVEARGFDAVNNQGTARLVEQAAAAGVRSFIFLSSIFALVDNASSEPLHDRSVSRAQSPYGLSKLAAEKHVAEFAGAGRTAVSLRPPLVYGASAKGNWRLLQKLAASPLPLPFGLVQNRRSLISIDNLVDAIIAAVSAGEGGQSGEFAVAEGEPVSLCQIVSLLRRGMGRSSRLLPIPPAMLELGLRLIGRGQMASSLLGNLEVDSTRFRDAYRWSPLFETQEGIRRSAAEFIDTKSRGTL